MTTTANTITGPAYGESRQMPWNVMGADLTGKAHKDLGKALKESGLDFDVRTLPVVAYDKADDEDLIFATFVEADKSRAVVRPTSEGEKVVGMVGTRYTPIQNRDAFAVATPLVGEYGATIVGMADFRHGGASLMVLDLGRPVNLVRPDGGTDAVDLNLLVKNSHDGSSALTFALTPMRLACTNALQAAIGGAERAWKISHTPNAQERMDLAVKAIKEAVGYQEKFAAAAQAMMDQPMVDAEFAKIVAGIWKVDPEATGKVADRKRETQAQVIDLYRNSPTLEGIRGTRWAGYNALTEYLDHYRPVKGQEDVARAEGALEGPNVRVKGNVWKMFATV
jgi:phage/plasmid-like protein (TIGR03299 family)